MRLLRYGTAWQERPVLLGQNGNVRDLSSVCTIGEFRCIVPLRPDEAH